MEDTYEKIDDKTIKVTKPPVSEELILNIDNLKLELENLNRQIADTQDRAANTIADLKERSDEVTLLISKANEVGVVDLEVPK